MYKILLSCISAFMKNMLGWHLMFRKQTTLPVGKAPVPVITTLFAHALPVQKFCHKGIFCCTWNRTRSISRFKLHLVVNVVWCFQIIFAL